MGILNVTEDSFSDGGDFYNTDKAIEHGIKMAQQGARLLHWRLSTRPGSLPVLPEEQIKRAVPVIKELAKKINIPISIDTYNYDVAKACLGAGAAIINDITAFSDIRIAKLAADLHLPVILMHMQGTPATMQIEPKYNNVVSEVLEYLLERAQIAKKAGIPKERIIIDPGIGFGKTLEHNLQLLRNIDKFINSGYRVLIGTSKKFIGTITGKENPKDRIFGTAATVAYCELKGADILRVHDVNEMLDVIRVVGAIQKTE